MKAAALMMGVALACGVARAEISEWTDADLAYARDGFGVVRNFYVNGRISAKVAAISGVFSFNYVGKQDYSKFNFININENCVFGRIFVPQVLIDDVPYRLTYHNTRHYPFGYTSECTLDGVRLAHEFVLDGNVAFRRIRVLENPQNKKVRARIVQQNNGWLSDGEDRVTTRFHVDGQTLQAKRVDSGVETTIEIGSMNEVSFPRNTHPPKPLAFRKTNGVQSFLFHLTETMPSDDHLFWFAFDRKAGEDLSVARVEKVFADFNARNRRNVKFKTGNPAFDHTLNYVPALSSYYEVDGIGGFRASPTYWVWGWDAMVHAGVLAMTGKKEEVKRMLDFFRKMADPKKGILHAYGTDFVYRPEEDSTAPGASYTMPAIVQLFYVSLLNDYYQITGDEETLKESLPFARLLIQNAKAAVDADRFLGKGYAFFPDNPFSVDQQLNDYAVINNGIYYQGLCAWNELTGEDAALCEKVKAAFEKVFWNAREGYWCDAVTEKDLAQLPHYTIYGPLYISRFALSLKSTLYRETAAYMKKHFYMGKFLNMVDVRSASHQADGNQYGAYYPTTDRYYWNVMNAAGREDAVADFRAIVSSHGKVLTYPEGQTADVVNGEPADYSDELGNKQFFATKAWLSDALELNLGLRVTAKGLSFNPLSDGTPFAVENLSFRKSYLSVKLSGKGTLRETILNGEPCADKTFIPWSRLKEGDNTLEFVLKD